MNRGALGLGLALLVLGPAARADDPPRPRIESPDGVPISFESRDPAMRAYLCRGDVPGGILPDPFEKLPPLPVTVRLSPGMYTVEAESVTASTAHQVIYVEQAAPMTVEVRPGNAAVKLTGSVLVVLGAISTILGVVAIASIAPHDQSYDRFGIGLPLLLGGAGVAGLGVGLTVLGSTDVRAPHLPPGGAPKTVSLVARF